MDEMESKKGATELLKNARAEYYQIRAAELVEALTKRNMEAFYVKTKEEALDKIMSLIPEGSTVSYGGSATLDEIGILERIRTGKYDLIDIFAAPTRDEMYAATRRSMLSDYFLMSSNAISLDGLLVNTDQAGNRTSNLLFGPENVIVVAGMNKVVNNEQDAINRVRNYVCPFHSININTNMNEKYTPCTKTGQCHDCLSKDTTCGHTVITRFSYFPNRIKVILVGEDLGI